MQGLEQSSSRRSRRLYRCAARSGTLFGIAILAVASCQSFPEERVRGPTTPVADHLEYDACLDRGGRYLMHAHTCVEREPAGRSPQ